ncbi:MAG TPA: ATP-binding protein [Planctomycetaceae bacterium]|jgi:signal transduction histidine kinase
MNILKHLSIRAKLNALGMLTAGTALLLACLVFVLNDVSATKTGMVQHLSALADVLGGNCAAALTFDDSKAAGDLLTSLRFEPAVRFGCIFDRHGREFAMFPGSGGTQSIRRFDARRKAGHVFEPDGTLLVVAKIHDNGEEIGTVALKAGLGQLDVRFRQQMLTALAVLAVSLGVSFMLSSRLQKIVSMPILQLASTAEYVSEKRDFSVRVEQAADDEIGSLCTAFNRMLERIEAGEAELKRSYDVLELRVEERTKQLSEANGGLSREVADRVRAEEDLRKLQAQHVDAARRAGMAEIATSVLHNVGNVLNSVNVSASVISDKLKKSGVTDLKRATGLLSQHLDDVGGFISTDPRGQHFPRFLLQLSEKMSTNEESILGEVKSLSKNIEHIKDIVSLQQSYASVSGFVEELSLADLVDDAIRINSESIARHKIELVRRFDELPPLLADKQKILQIVVNLISNAKYAVIATDQPNRRITVRLRRTDGSRVLIEVSDNGMGIAPENLTRIFSHGFTTRKDGHGFGLHGAANLAKAMGATLSVHSDGPGKGAAFIFEMPFKTAGVPQ